MGTCKLRPLVDKGEVSGATGTTSFNPDGSPASYVVAPDDMYDGILERFGIASDYCFIYLNSVRRHNNFTFYAGDTLNLDPHTILTVGDENGEVNEFLDRLASPHPEQR